MNSYVAIGFVLCCSPVLVLVSGMPQFVGYSGQQQQQQAYLQQQISQPQPAYLTAGLLQQQPQGVYNDGQRAPQQFAPQLPTQRVPQLLLPTNVDRQVLTLEESLEQVPLLKLLSSTEDDRFAIE